MMVLLGNPGGYSSRPPGSARWNGNGEGFGAVFGGRMGAVTLLNAFNP